MGRVEAGVGKIRVEAKINESRLWSTKSCTNGNDARISSIKLGAIATLITGIILIRIAVGSDGSR